MVAIGILTKKIHNIINSTIFRMKIQGNDYLVSFLAIAIEVGFDFNMLFSLVEKTV